jgi:hypothetical protein
MPSKRGCRQPTISRIERESCNLQDSTKTVLHFSLTLLKGPNHLAIEAHSETHKEGTRIHMNVNRKEIIKQNVLYEFTYGLENEDSE